MLLYFVLCNHSESSYVAEAPIQQFLSLDADGTRRLSL